MRSKKNWKLFEYHPAKLVPEGYIALNRLDEAKALYRQAIDRKLEYQFLHDDMYENAFLEGDRDEMNRQVAAVAGKPGLEDILFSAESDTEAFYGRLGKARQLTTQAVTSALRAEEKETASLWQLSSALREVEFGNAERARQEVSRGLAIAFTRDVKTAAALTFACAGDSSRARAMADDLQKQSPLNTTLNHYWLPAVCAYIELRAGNPGEAVKLLEDAVPYDLAFPPPQFSEGGQLYPVFVRGQAYLALRQGKQAAAEFQKFIDHRTIVANSPLAALAHVGLARALLVSGDREAARIAYQDFFALWKDADPDIPILKQAKAEYAKLK